MTVEKKQRIIDEYLNGYCINNLATKTKSKETEMHEILIEYHALKGYFYLDEFKDWICPVRES
jgi:hypothetical protein